MRYISMAAKTCVKLFDKFSVNLRQVVKTHSPAMRGCVTVCLNGLIYQTRSRLV